jgi:integrase
LATDTAFLKQRRQTWYFQIAVPRELQVSLGQLRGSSKPVPVLVQSLGTRDKMIAQRLRWDKHREAIDLFDRLRGRKTLTLAEIEEAAEATFRKFLRDAAEGAKRGTPIVLAPEQGPHADGEQTEYGGLELYLGDLAEELAGGENYGAGATATREVLERLGATRDVLPGSPRYQELRESQLRALIQAARGRMAFLRGEVYEPKRPFARTSVDPLTLAVTQPSAEVRKKPTGRSGDKFSDAAARYVAEMQRDAAAAWTKQTQHQNELTYRLFSDYLNGASVSSVTREDAVKFLGLIATLHPDYGRSPSAKGKSLAGLLELYGDKDEALTNKTLNRHTTSLNSLFKWAKRTGIYTGDNPFSGLLRKVGRGKEWLPLNTEELNLLFHSPLLTEAPRAKLIKPDEHTSQTALAWVPLIALFSGMRSEEICQLRVEDVRKEDDVWYFNVAEENGQRVKSEAGTRRVPIHSTLVKAGFLDYLKHAKKHRSGQLFPGLRRGGPDRKFNHYLTGRIGAHFTKLTITRDRVAFHSLRKNVVQAFERARVHQSEAALIVGHERGFTYTRYNPLGLELPALRRIVEKIKYPGLDLSHLAV